MSPGKLAVKDLPLGMIAGTARYNLLAAESIELLGKGQEISAERIQELEKSRDDLWREIQERKDEGMPEYARFVAGQYGFGIDPQGNLTFSWKSEGHNRIGYQSDFYKSDPQLKKLVPTPLDHSRPRMIIFSTGRAFAERNARLMDLSSEEAIEHARFVMSAQAHLVESRLVGAEQRDNTQVVAFAYDMVESDQEVPAIRMQMLLDPDFIHPVAAMTSERVFGDLIAKAEFNSNGTLVRHQGTIQGTPRADDEIIDHLSGLILVGGSIGCVMAFQAVQWLDRMLGELGVSKRVRQEAGQSFLLLNLGPTTVLPEDRPFNRIDVINRVDEFVFAGNDVAPIIARADETGRCLVSGPEPGGHVFSLVFDGPGSVIDTAEGKIFDPDSTHFGHSMKFYANWLRDIGFPSVIERTLQTRGTLDLGGIIQWAESEGKLKLPSPTDT
ncbi:MAG: hypothetical protein VYC91_08015 [Acidobacteriota bacterium]|nr:hypothetical protein [Acidobacteriota bacterium]